MGNKATANTGLHGSADLDPASELVDALYALAEQPENWLGALEAIERLPPLDETDRTAERLAQHATRAAALAEQLNRTRHLAERDEEQWDALLLSAEGNVRAVIGRAEERLRPFLTAPVAPYKRPEFHADIRAGLNTAVEAVRDGRNGGLVHWTPTRENTGERSFALVIARAAFPRSLAQAFGLSEMGAEPLYALAVLNTERRPSDDYLRESLSLSHAEWRLVKVLANGTAVTDAAGQIGISVNTARTQLKSIFAKLGVSRQSELVSRIEFARRLDLARGPMLAARTHESAPPRSFITLDDGRTLAYREYGDPRGKPTIGFHQWFAASMLPTRAMEAVKDSGLRFVVFDRPGFGLSTPLPSYTFAAVARDAFVLADRLQMPRFRVIGMASGASFAMTAATMAPARVEKLALAAPRIQTHAPASSRASGARGQFVALLRQPWLIRSFLNLVRSSMGERLALAMLRHAAANSPSDRKQVANPAIARAILAQAFDAHEATFDGLAAELLLFANSQLPDPRIIRCPLVVWHGAHDGTTPADLSRRTFAGIPGVSFHLLPNEGIVWSVETYKAFLASVLA